MKLDDRLDISRSQILNLWNEGKDTSDIAAIIGVHESVIYNALAKMNGKTLPAPEKRRRSA
jgi:transposase